MFQVPVHFFFPYSQSSREVSCRHLFLAQKLYNSLAIGLHFFSLCSLNPFETTGSLVVESGKTKEASLKLSTVNV